MTRGRLGRWTPALLWMVLIFWLSAQPKPPLSWLSERVDFADKLGHFAVYAVLGGLLWRALRRSYTGRRLILLVAVISVAYGLTDEIHQIFVTGRSFDLLDLMVDGIGATLAAVFLTMSIGGDGNVGRTGTGQRLRGQGQEKSEP